MPGDVTRRMRVRLPALPLAALALLVVGVLSLAPTLSTSLAQQRQIEDTEARIAEQRADLADLTAQRARWSDPAYVRAQAGSRLYYVMPGTTAYRVTHSTAVDDAPARTARPDRTPWTTALAGSLVTAGTTEQSPAALRR